MADTVDKKTRSRIMGKVRGKNTAPEIFVRSLLHKMGFRFKLHEKKLPGSPDIVLPKYKTAIFVHGCFWHRHENCKKATTPSSNVVFWTEKFKRNIERDAYKTSLLREGGWQVLTIWECQCSPSTQEDLATFIKTKLSFIARD